MINATQIKEHMKVVSADGKHVGTVDHMEGSEMIKLTKNDPAARGHHHYIPLAWVDEVEDKIKLSKSHDDVVAEWQHSAM